MPLAVATHKPIPTMQVLCSLPVTGHARQPIVRSLWQAVPDITISEDDRHFAVEVLAPGLCRHDFKVERCGNQLLIETLNRNLVEDDTHQHPGSPRHISRTFTLPESVMKNNIVSYYKNGMLVVTIAKA